MKFATILREVGISSRVFPACGEINVVLYDEMDQIHEEDDVRFIKPLFADNEESYDRFFTIVDKIDSEPISKIDLKITENHVVIFYNSPAQVILPRKRPMDPLDYMA